MGKARMYGKKSNYIPNAQADRRRRPKLHEKHLQAVDDERIEERRERKMLKELERMKYGVFECEPLSSYGNGLEVIGNIHDNPELLEVPR